jgi:hypothetical protein
MRSHIKRDVVLMINVGIFLANQGSPNKPTAHFAEAVKIEPDDEGSEAISEG